MFVRTQEKAKLEKAPVLSLLLFGNALLWIIGLLTVRQGGLWVVVGVQMAFYTPTACLLGQGQSLLKEKIPDRSHRSAFKVIVLGKNAVPALTLAAISLLV